MNRKVLWTLIQKELRQVLRNKRVLIGLLLPVILLPLLFGIYSTVMADSDKKSAEEKSEIVIVSTLPTQLETLILNDDRLQLTQGAPAELDDLDKKTYDMGLTYEYVDGQHQFKCYYDSGRSSGRKAYDRLMESVTIFERVTQEKFLTDRQVSVTILDPIDIVEEDVANIIERSGKSLGDIIPMMLTVMALLSVVNFAIEMTTGEKEVGTLETLLSLPITRVELVLSKLLACICFGLFSMLINLGMLLSLLPQIMSDTTFVFAINGQTVMILIVTLFPLILIGSGISLGVGMFANSFKESGAYITPLTFLFMIPAYVGLIPGVTLNEFLAAVPIVNSTLLIKSVFIGDFNMTYCFIGFASNMLFSLLALIFMIKVFGAEKLLFGDDKGLSLRIDRKNIERKTFIESQDALMIVVIAIVMFIYLGSVAANVFGIVYGTMSVQILSFAIMPLFLTWYMKGNLKESIGIKVPKVIPSVAGVFLWIGALSIMLVYQMFVTPFVQEAPTLVGLEETLNQMGFVMKFVFIALTPGICEELLFRGIAFNPLKNAFGPKKAIIITSVLFALMHLDVVRLVPTFILGLVLGIVVYKSGSIIPGMILHILNNTVALFVLDKIDISIEAFIIMGIVAGSIGILLIKNKTFTKVPKEAYESEWG